MLIAGRRRRWRVLCYCAIAAIVSSAGYSSWVHTATSTVTFPTSPRAAIKTPRYAFVTFLAPNVEEDAGMRDDADPGEDSYFVAVRVLAYRLLHAPFTKSPSYIPVIVMTTPDVAPAKIDRLRRDGAVVVEMPRLNSSWAKPATPRYRVNFTKLRMFQLTAFDRILYLDSDMLITRPLDAIFHDPAAVASRTVNRTAALVDEGHLPNDYAFAALSEPNDGYQHETLPDTGDAFSAGFLLFKPDAVLFQHYVSIMNIKGRVPNDFAEQDVLNYAHRPSGNLPWKRLHRDWDTSFPTWADYHDGVATLHDKWWASTSAQLGAPQGPDTRLQQLWRQHRAEMEAFYGPQV